MHFVHDINFIFNRNGRKLNVIAQLANFVYAVVGRRVDFKHVDVRRVGKSLASGALAAWRTVYGVFAVNGFRENFGGGGFARAARSRKKIRMTDSARFNLIDERLNDMFLPISSSKRAGRYLLYNAR